MSSGRSHDAKRRNYLYVEKEKFDGWVGGWLFTDMNVSCSEHGISECKKKNGETLDSEKRAAVSLQNQCSGDQALKVPSSRRAKPSACDVKSKGHCGRSARLFGLTRPVKNLRVFLYKFSVRVSNRNPRKCHSARDLCKAFSINKKCDVTSSAATLREATLNANERAE